MVDKSINHPQFTRRILPAGKQNRRLEALFSEVLQQIPAEQADASAEEIRDSQMLQAECRLAYSHILKADQRKKERDALKRRAS